MASFLDFFRISSPSAAKVAPENTDKVWKRSRFQSFIAITFGYALYYVCRMSMGVMKQPLIDAGLLNATQLGVIGACLYWTYAVGKLVNGFLADGSNVKRFMATGLVLSAAANLIMGVLGATAVSAGISSSIIFIVFAHNVGHQRLGAVHGFSAFHRHTFKVVPVEDTWHVLWIFQCLA